MRLLWFAAFLMCGSLLRAQASTTAKHPFSFDDWAGLHSASAAAVSPDGKTILYAVRFGASKGRTTTEWHTIGFDGENSKKLTLPDGFTPSGFTADGGGLYGSYKINNVGQFAIFALPDLGAKSVPQITVLLPRGMQGAAPSPDGSRYALLADPRSADDLADTRTVIEPEETSLYVVNANGTGGAWWCSDLRHISGGAFDLYGNPSITWAPDSSSLAVIATTPKIGYHYVRSWIDNCSAAGSRRLTEIDNSVAGLAWTNDGNLAFLSTGNSVLTTDAVYTIPVNGGKAVSRTPNLDGSAVAITGDPHGHIWVLVSHGIRSDVMEFKDNALRASYQWPDGVVLSPPVSSPYAGSAAALVFDVGDPNHAANLAVSQGTSLHRLTTESDDLLAKVELGAVQDIHWTSKDNIELQGIATFPARYEQGRKYPFLVLPHGGAGSERFVSVRLFFADDRRPGLCRNSA